MSASTVASERRCVGVDRRCKESEGKAKIEGYMSVSDEEAHQQDGSCAGEDKYRFCIFLSNEGIEA